MKHKSTMNERMYDITIVHVLGVSWGNDMYESLVPVCRRGLLAYVYNGVSLTMNVLNALVAGNGSYIVRPCGHDLHGPTSPFVRQN